MTRSRGCALLCVALLLPMASCTSALGEFLNVITLEVINDTSFAVQPNIVFDDDSGLLAALFPASELATGLLAPGDVATVRFDCDDFGSMRIDDAEQVIPGFANEFADTSTIEIDEDFECGDRIQVQFVGDGVDFGVVLLVNGRVIGD